MGSLAPQMAHWNAAKTSGTGSDIIRFPGLSHEFEQLDLLLGVRLKKPKS
jgi:hypothetical protein